MSAAAIRELLADYVLALDADEVDECLQLFTEDAEFEVYGRVFVGRDDIGTMFRRAPHGLHLLGASHVDVVGDDATARSQLLFVEAGGRQLRSARYDDEVIRRGGRWLFRRRQCRFITRAGLSVEPEVQS